MYSWEAENTNKPIPKTNSESEGLAENQDKSFETIE